MSQATEEADSNGKRAVHGGQTDSWRVSSWRLFETLEQNFAASKHPADPLCQIRRDSDDEDGATG
jgi:hypothetical protein